MNYTIEYQLAGNFLLVIPEGTRSLDAHMDLALSIDEASRKHNCTMVMVDITRLTGSSPGAIKDFQFAQFAGKLAAGKYRKIALIYPPEPEITALT